MWTSSNLNLEKSRGTPCYLEHIHSSVRMRANSYDRGRDLPALVGLDHGEADDRTPLASMRILRRLGRALRWERRRGRAATGDYDVARHLALLQAYRAEAAMLERSGEPRSRLS